MSGRAVRGCLMGLMFVSAALTNGHSALASQGSEQGLVGCFIKAERSDGAYVMRAFARTTLPDSDLPVIGTFRLTIAKRSGGGSSRTIQQGQFELLHEGEKQLSFTAFEASAEGHVAASLRLETGRGIVSCNFPE